jgi:hypothetical protein
MAKFVVVAFVELAFTVVKFVIVDVALLTNNDPLITAKPPLLGSK